MPQLQCIWLNEVTPTSLLKVFFLMTKLKILRLMWQIYLPKWINKKKQFCHWCQWNTSRSCHVPSNYYKELPHRKMYWWNSSELLSTAVFNAMSRNCFEELLSVLHLRNNGKLDKSDKLKLQERWEKIDLVVLPLGINLP